MKMPVVTASCSSRTGRPARTEFQAAINFPSLSDVQYAADARRSLSAFRIAEARALIAALDADERRFAAFGALCEPRRGAGIRQVDDLALLQRLERSAARRQEAAVDHMAFEDIA